MMPVIIDEIDRFMSRANLSAHAQFVSITCLSQFLLSDDAPEVACKLISFYLGVFKRLLSETNAANYDAKKTQKADNKTKSQKKPRHRPRRGKASKSTANVGKRDETPRIFSALLTGLNRAFPYSGDETFSDDLDYLFGMARNSNIGTSIQVGPFCVCVCVSFIAFSFALL